VSRSAPGADSAPPIADAFDFFAAVQAPFRMQPGLRRLAEGSRQLHPNSRDSRHLREKLQALHADAHGLQCTPGYDPLPGCALGRTRRPTPHPRWTATPALGLAVRGGELRPTNDSAPMPGSAPPRICPRPGTWRACCRWPSPRTLR
jgi:hypothetical protein